jgi:hypothetical protein
MKARIVGGFCLGRFVLTSVASTADFSLKDKKNDWEAQDIT